MCVLFLVDLSHNSVSPRVELVTWSSFWVLVKRDHGTQRCSAAFSDISVTQPGCPTFIVIQLLSAGKTFSLRLSEGLNMAGTRCFQPVVFLRSPLFSVSISTVWLDFVGACPPERREQASLFRFWREEKCFFKAKSFNAPAMWRWLQRGFCLSPVDGLLDMAGLRSRLPAPVEASKNKTTHAHTNGPVRQQFVGWYIVPKNTTINSGKVDHCP